jgi:hypothetical protein
VAGEFERLATGQAHYVPSLSDEDQMTRKERRLRILRGWLLAGDKTLTALEAGKLKTGERPDGG